MFKATGTQEARNEQGIMVEIDGYAVRYHENNHVLEFGAEPGLPSSPQREAMFNIYFPAKLRWKAPHQDEPIPAQKSQQIENDLKEALEALNCEINFTIPIG